MRSELESNPQKQNDFYTKTTKQEDLIYELKTKQEKKTRAGHALGNAITCIHTEGFPTVCRKRPTHHPVCIISDKAANERRGSCGSDGVRHTSKRTTSSADILEQSAAKWDASLRALIEKRVIVQCAPSCQMFHVSCIMDRRRISCSCAIYQILSGKNTPHFCEYVLDAILGCWGRAPAYSKGMTLAICFATVYAWRHRSCAVRVCDLSKIMLSVRREKTRKSGQFVFTDNQLAQ